MTSKYEIDRFCTEVIEKCSSPELQNPMKGETWEDRFDKGWDRITDSDSVNQIRKAFVKTFINEELKRAMRASYLEGENKSTPHQLEIARREEREKCKKELLLKLSLDSSDNFSTIVYKWLGINDDVLSEDK